MSLQILPIDASVPYYSVDVVLDGLQYTFQVKYNYRDEAWYFNLLDAEQNMLVAGRKFVVGGSLFNGLVVEGRPPGWLVAMDSSSHDLDPTEDDLGERVYVVYVPYQDLVDAGLI